MNSNLSQLNVSDMSLVFAFALVLVAVAISYKEKLRLSKEIFYAVARAIVQLTIVGYVLKYIFQVNNAIFTMAMTLVIVFNAAWNAYQRNPNSHKRWWGALAAVTVSTYATLGVLLLSGVIRFTPSQVIPIIGMIAGNGMVAIGLCYRTMAKQFHDQRQQVLEKLALGASVKLSAAPILRESIKTAMQPTIDSAKTLGLVSLPGMMSGLIFAGLDPVHAIKYQIMVTFMLLAAASLGSIIAGYAAYRDYYNIAMQLRA